METNNIEKVKSDPSLGVITLSHVTATRQRLHGSHLNHHAFLSIKIHAGEILHSSDEDRILPLHSECVAEVYLTPAQFANFITSAGNGGGTPCTFRYREGKGYVNPVPIPVETPHDAFRKAVKRDASEIARQANEVESMIAKNSKLTKKDREEMLDVVTKMKQNIAENMPWLVTQLQRQMDAVVSDAQIAAENYVDMMVKNRGLEAIRNEFPTLGTPDDDVLLVEGTVETAEELL